MMICEVKYFGMIAEKIGKTNEKIDLNLVESDLKLFFIDRYPILINMTFKVAVDGLLTNVINNREVKMIALLPPFAGG